MCKLAEQNFNADREITKLVNQINDLKQSAEEDANTNADMYTSMQTKLMSREEEINRLKHRLSKLEGGETPTSDGTRTPIEGISGSDPIQLKLKIRELANALKNVTAQRNSAIERLKNTDDTRSGASSYESLPDHSQLVDLENENQRLKSKLEQEANSSTLLKDRIKSLTEEHDRTVATVKELKEGKRVDVATISELRDQVSSIVNEMAELTDDYDKVKRQLNEMKNQATTTANQKQNDSLSVEQVRQEARERQAGLEYRLRIVQQKLEQSEQAKLVLEKDLETLRLKPQPEPVAKENGVEKGNGVNDALTAKDGEILKLKTAIEGLEANVKQSSETNETITKQVEEKELLVKQLQVDLEEAKMTCLVQTAELERLSKSVKQHQEKLEKAKEAYTQKEEQIIQLKQDVASVKQQSSVRVKELEAKLKDVGLEHQKNIQALEGTISQKSGKIRELEDRLTEAVDQLSKLKAEISLLNEKEKVVVEELQKKINSIQSDHKAVLLKSETEIGKREAEINKLKAQVHNVKEEMFKIEAAAAEKQSKTQTLVEQSEEKALKLELAMGQLLVEKGHLNDNVLEQNQTISDLEMKLSHLNHQLKDSKGADVSRLAELEVNTQSINGENQRLKAKLEKAEAELAQKYSEVEKLRTEELHLKESKSKSAALEQELEKRSNLLKEMEKSVVEKESLLQKTIAELSTSKKEYDGLQSKFKDVKVQIETSTERIKALEGDKANLLSQVTGSQENVAQLQKSITSKTRELEDMGESLLKLQSSHASLQALVVDLEKKLSSEKETADRQLKELKTKLEAVQGQNQDLKAKSEKNLQVQGREEELQSLLETSRKELDDVKAQKNAYEKELSARDVEITQMKKQTASLESEIASSSEKLLLVTKELEESKTFLEKVTRELDAKLKLESSELNLEEEKQNLEKKYQELQDTHRSSQTSLQVTEKTVAELKAELEETTKKLGEEQEKKTKSIQLLRNSKNRIIKLEGDLKVKEEECTKLSKDYETASTTLAAKEATLKEKLLLVTDMTKQIEEYQKTVPKLQDAFNQLGPLKEELTAEKKKFADLVQDTKTTQKRLQDELVYKIQELKEEHDHNLHKLKDSNSELSSQIKQFSDSLQLAENRIENIDAELATSKGLFENKCSENDQLKMAVSEMEVKIFEKAQELSKALEDKSVLQKEFKARLKSFRESKEVIHSLKDQVEQLTKENESVKVQLEAKSEQIISLEKDIKELKSSNSTKIQNESDQVKKLAVDNVFLFNKVKIHELEEKLRGVMIEKTTWQSEKDSLLADFRMREVQLKNLNKALKEEVRKLNRSGSASSSVVGSPLLSRSDSMDAGVSQSIPISQLPPPNPPPTQSQPSNTRTSDSSTRTAAALPSPEPEYVKNVVLKFLESNKRSQRKQLIGVLGMLLKFTPEELRLAEKVV